MQNLYFQIMLIFILIIFFIYKILVRTSKKVKNFDAKYHFINFVFVGLIGASISLNTGNALISILATIMMAFIVISERSKGKKGSNLKKVKDDTDNKL